MQAGLPVVGLPAPQHNTHVHEHNLCRQANAAHTANIVRLWPLPGRNMQLTERIYAETLTQREKAGPQQKLAKVLVRAIVALRCFATSTRAEFSALIECHAKYARLRVAFELAGTSS